MTPEKFLDSINKPLSMKEVLFLDELLDKQFGIEHIDLQGAPEELYGDLSKAALSTCYVDYWKVLTALAPHQTLVDLGAGYARGTLLSSFLNLRKCKSIELAKKRLTAAFHYLRDSENKYDLVLDSIENYQADSDDVFYVYMPLNKTLLKTLRNILLACSPAVVDFVVCESHGDLIPFFENLGESTGDILFENSLPRHNQYTLRFSLKSDVLQSQLQDNICGWWVQHHDSLKVLEFEYHHLLLNQKVKLMVKCKNLDLVYQNEEFYFQHSRTGRIFNTDREFKLLECKNINQYAPRIQEVLSEPIYEDSKILWTNQLLREDPTGKISSL